jgi:hypothetical protein
LLKKWERRPGDWVYNLQKRILPFSIVLASILPTMLWVVDTASIPKRGVGHKGFLLERLDDPKVLLSDSTFHF